MISLWWSFTLTVIGVTGLVLVYRSQSIVGPLVGLAVQGLWIAYALATGQWWFLVSAFAFSAANLYGVTTRRKKAASQAKPTEWRGPWEVRARLAETRLSRLEAAKKVAPFVDTQLHGALVEAHQIVERLDDSMSCCGTCTSGINSELRTVLGRARPQ